MILYCNYTDSVVLTGPSDLGIHFTGLQNFLRSGTPIRTYQHGTEHTNLSLSTHIHQKRAFHPFPSQHTPPLVYTYFIRLVWYGVGVDLKTGLLLRAVMVGGGREGHRKLK